MGNGAILNQPVATIAAGAQDRAGNGKDIAGLFGGKAGCNERAAALCCFDDDHRQTQAADDAVAGWKIAGFGASAQRVFADQRALFDDLHGQPSIAGGIDVVDTAAKDSNCASASVKGGLMGDRVYAERQPTDDGHAVPGQVGSQLAGHFASIGGDAPRADNGHGKFVLLFKLAAHVQERRGLWNFSQIGGIAVIVPAEYSVSAADDLFQLRLRVQVLAGGQQILDAAAVESRCLQ